MLDAPLLATLVEEARLAPSVHNIQPTRWALADPTTILLLELPGRRLPAADPKGRDVAISHGAAMEGMLLALAARGLAATPGTPDQAAPGGLRPIASLRVEPGPVATDCGRLVQRRATWRGRFVPPYAEHRLAAERLAADDLVVVTDPAALTNIAVLGDEAAMFFLRDNDHRRELLHWMRLSRAHPGWSRDGLNARSMDLGRIEASAAGLVLGPLFRPLDRLGAAAPLLAERTKTRSAGRNPAVPPSGRRGPRHNRPRLLPPLAGNGGRRACRVPDQCAGRLSADEPVARVGSFDPEGP